MNEEKLIGAVLPKISNYFKENLYLKKEKLTEFLDYIDLNVWEEEEEKELLWQELSKGYKSENEIQRIGVIKNLTNFIHTHGQNLFQPEKNLESSVKHYFSSLQPYFSNDLSDSNYDTLYELYKLLSLIQYNLKKKAISINDLDELLKSNIFIKLDREGLENILKEVRKGENINEIDMNAYFTIMEKLSIKFKLKQSEILQKIFTFDDNELELPEDKRFCYLGDYINILIQLRETLILIYERIKEDKTQSELRSSISSINSMNSINSQREINDFFDRYFNVIINCFQIYIDEIQELNLRQKQKFDFYGDREKAKFSFLEEEREELEKRLKERKNIQNDDKSLREAIQKLVEEINQANIRNDQMAEELKSMKKDLTKKEDELYIANDKINNLEKENKEIKSQYNSLERDKENLNNNYISVLNELNNKVFNKNKEGKVEKDIQEKMNLSEEQKNLVSIYHGELVTYIIEKDKYCAKLEEENDILKEKIKQNEKTISLLEKELSNYKAENSSLVQKNNSLQYNLDLINKELDINKSNKGHLLSSLISQGDEVDVLKMTRTINITFAGQKNKVNKVVPKKVNFDYLCLKLDEKVVHNLDDDYYNTSSNLIFSEHINYLDENKQFISCLIFISSSFLYIFNKKTYDKCFSISLLNLTTINASTNNNLISLSFYTGEIIIFEIFRVLEFINFFKALNAYEKGNNYSINVNKYNNKFLEAKKTRKNYTNSPYFGKAQLSGHLIKKTESILMVNFIEIFAVLSDIGLIILEAPMGKPLEIINLLFAKHHEYEDKGGHYCFEIAVGKNRYVFIAESALIRQQWMNEIEKWILSIYNEKAINI